MKGKLSCLLMGLLILLIIISAGAAGQPAINFGTITASEENSRKVSAVVPLAEEGVEVLEIWLEGYPATTNRNLSLEGQRLSLECSQGFFWVGINPIFIPLGAGEGSAYAADLPVFLTINVYPADLPGSYQTVLVIRALGAGAIINEFKIPLQVKVGSWFQIETPVDRINISSLVSGEGTLLSIPGTVRMASNSPWELLVRGELEGGLERGHVELTLSGEKTGNFKILNSPVVIRNQDFTCLGQGEPTTGTKGTGWVELGFVVKIQDYTRLPAGRISFPLNFYIVPALDAN